MIAYNAAISYYGENLVDRQGDYLFILYPELVIRDTGNRTHIIRNLILRIDVDNNRITGLNADRFTMTDIEYACNNYIHSHVSGAEWGNFCLGESDVRDLINQSVQGEFTEDNWCLFFLTMENFLQVESGSPYKRIRNLNLENIKGTYYHFTEESYYKAFKKLFPDYKFELTLNSRTKLLELELSTQFYKDFALVLPNELKGVYDDSVDKARQTRRGEEKLFVGFTKRTFKFRGQMIRQQVTSTTERCELPKDYPLDYVCQKIKEFLNNKVYEAARVKNHKPITKDRIKDLSVFVRRDMELAQEN